MTPEHLLVERPREPGSKSELSEDSAVDLREWHLKSARMLLAASDWSGALWRLNRVLESAADDVEARLDRAWALSHLGRFDDARIDLRLLSEGGDRGRVKNWLSSLTQAASARHEWSVMLPFVDAWIELSPQDDLPYALRCEAWGGLDRPADAAQDAYRVAELLENNERLLSACFEQIQLGNLVLADALLEKASRRPDFPLSYYHYLALGRLRRNDQAGYRALASQWLERLRGNHNLSAGELNSVLWIFTLAPDAVDQWEGLLELGRKVVGQSPAGNKHQVLNTLGGLQLRAGMYDAAIESLNSGLQHAEGQGVYQDYVFLALCSARLGRIEEARRYWQESQSERVAGQQNVWSRLEFAMFQQELAALVGR
ncbi:MAG: hypothetical protein JSS02_35195 [Planctomycetes bacterium]|nr:hypothetical protein [Planctomycetota bacterium]